MVGRRVRPRPFRRGAAALAAVLVSGVGMVTAAGLATAGPAGSTPGQEGTSTSVTAPTTTTAPAPSTTASPSTTSVTAPTTTTVPGSPTLTVTPATGVEAGDTVTVSGTGWGAGGFVTITGCTAAVLTDPQAPFDECEEQGTTTYAADDGSFSVDVEAATPGWEAVHARGGLPGAVAATPIDVVDPAAPEVRVRVPWDTVPAGQWVSYWGYASPVALAGEVGALACHAVPTSGSDPAAVEAACGPLADAAPTGPTPVGGVGGAVRVEAGDEAVWVGGRLDGALVGHVVPVTVVADPAPPEVVVTPGEDLVDGQSVTVSGSGAFPGRTYVAVQCDGAVLADGVTEDELLYDCADPRFGTPVPVAADGTFSVAHVVRRDVTVGIRPVHCDARPGACAVVLNPLYFPGGVPGGTAVSFRPVPPVVAPQAVRVTEGDGGTTVAEVPVHLDKPSSTPVTVEYTTFDAPALPWAATYGEDAEPAAGTLTFPPGEVYATIAVTVIGDTEAEGEEMALLGIASADGATIGGFAGIGGVVIDDDD